MIDLNNKVTFLLPAYKNKFLRESIKSILSQSYTNLELIIIDDASPELINDTVSLFDDNRIKYMRLDNNRGGLNMMKHWNECLNMITTPLMVMASDDDVYHPLFLERMMQLVVKYPKVNLFHSRSANINDRGDILDVRAPNAELEEILDFMVQRIMNHRSLCAQEFLIRTDALRAIGGFIDFPLGWFSDDATWFSLAQNNGVAASNETLFYMRNSNISLSGMSGNNTIKIEATLLYINWLRSFLSELNDNNFRQKELLDKNAFIQIDVIIITLISKLSIKDFIRIIIPPSRISTSILFKGFLRLTQRHFQN